MTENESGTEASEYTKRASNLFYIGRYAEALELFDRAIALDPRITRAHSGRGITLAQLGLPQDGYDAAQRALALEPGFANAYCVAGLCLHRMGKLEDAAAAYARAIDLASDDARVLYNYACFWAELRDEEKCREYLTRAFRHVDYEAIDHSREDPDLARYVDTDWFREVLANAKIGRQKKHKDD